MSSDSTAVTIDFLRAQLLSQELVSRSWAKRAEYLAKRVLELEERLRLIALQRNRAVKAAAKVLTILGTQEISDLHRPSQYEIHDRALGSSEDSGDAFPDSELDEHPSSQDESSPCKSCIDYEHPRCPKQEHLKGTLRSKSRGSIVSATRSTKSLRKRRNKIAEDKGREPQEQNFVKQEGSTSPLAPTGLLTGPEHSHLSASEAEADSEDFTFPVQVGSNTSTEEKENVLSDDFSKSVGSNLDENRLVNGSTSVGGIATLNKASSFRTTELMATGSSINGGARRALKHAKAALGKMASKLPLPPTYPPANAPPINMSDLQFGYSGQNSSTCLFGANGYASVPSILRYPVATSLKQPAAPRVSVSMKGSISGTQNVQTSVLKNA